MILKKILVTALLFVATNAGVMAAVADYGFFGGKNAKVATVMGHLKLVPAAGGGKGDINLTLDDDVVGKLKGVTADQFTAMEKPGKHGTATTVAANVITFMQDFYNALEAAAAEVKSPGERGIDALSHWIQNLKPADRVVKVTVMGWSDFAKLIENNRAKKEELAAKVKWDILNASDMATILTELNGTPGALRPATNSSPAYANAQAAYEAYQVAKSSGNVAAAKKTLEDAATLRVGKKKYTLENLADMNKPMNAVARVKYEAMKEKVLRKTEERVKAVVPTGASSNPAKFGEEAMKAIIREAGRGKIKPLQNTTAMRGLLIPKYDQTSLESLGPAVLANALITGLIEMNKTIIERAAELRAVQEDIERTGKQIAEAERQATLLAVISKATATTGGSGGKGSTPTPVLDELDAMGLFGADY